MSAGTRLMVTGQRGARRPHRIDPIVFGASDAFDAADLDDIFPGLRQRLGQSRGEAPSPFQGPDSPAGRVLAGPVQHAGVSGAIRRGGDVCTDAAGGGIEYRQVDGVAVRVSSDDVLVI